jgi:hypothetical protein
VAAGGLKQCPDLAGELMQTIEPVCVGRQMGESRAPLLSLKCAREPSSETDFFVPIFRFTSCIAHLHLAFPELTR